jgi:cell division protein FtsZ
MHNNRVSDNNNLEISQPVIIVGIGGAGSRLAVKASKLLGCKCILISNDKKDLDENYDTILINSNSWLNPSSYKLRSFAQSSANAIRTSFNDSHTIIVLANLAGTAGTAIAPIVCREAKLSAAQTVLSFAIMPFKFEKNRIFQAGVSLKRVRDLSNATIIIDNDALLDNNPELSSEECYEITNASIYELLSSISKGYIQPKMSLLCMSRIRAPSAESSLQDSLAMLYQNTYPTSVKRAIIHIIGGRKVPIGVLGSLVGNLQGIFKEGSDADTEFSVSLSGTDNLRVHLMASIEGKTRFDKYDPISEIIPKENVLDWDELDSSPDIEIKIPNLE